MYIKFLSHPFPLVDAIAAATFENIMAKGEIAHDGQFLLWSQCFKLYLTINLLLRFFRFLSLCFQSSAVDLLYVGKG